MRVIEGYVDQFVEPEGFDANDGELIYFQKTKQLSMDLPATLIVGDTGIPKTQVIEMLRKMNRILAFGRTESSNGAVNSMLELYGFPNL